MTDRAQPGARGSTMRNIEAGEATSQYGDGWIVPAAEPTLSATRYADLDETQFDEFDATYGAGSLTVTIAAGEAFVSGWVARDVTTDIDLAADTADQDVVLAWNPDAVYDDQQHATRDEADEAVVDLSGNVPDDYPAITLWTFTTDANGVTDAVDARDIGPTADAETVSAARRLTIPSYATEDDLPNQPEASVAYVEDEQQLYVFKGA